MRRVTIEHKNRTHVRKADGLGSLRCSEAVVRCFPYQEPSGERNFNAGAGGQGARVRGRRMNGGWRHRHGGRHGRPAAASPERATYPSPGRKAWVFRERHSPLPFFPIVMPELPETHVDGGSFEVGPEKGHGEAACLGVNLVAINAGRINAEQRSRLTGLLSAGVQENIVTDASREDGEF